MDGAGNIFIADRGNGRIRKVPQVEPSRRWQAPVRRASPANLFISEACRVRQGSASGIITTVAGGGTLFGAHPLIGGHHKHLTGGKRSRPLRLQKKNLK